MNINTIDVTHGVSGDPWMINLEMVTCVTQLNVTYKDDDQKSWIAGAIFLMGEDEPLLTKELYPELKKIVEPLIDEPVIEVTNPYCGFAWLIKVSQISGITRSKREVDGVEREVGVVFLVADSESPITTAQTYLELKALIHPTRH